MFAVYSERVFARLFVLLPCLAIGCHSGPAQPAPTFGHRVVNVYPHDPGAFTQGLAYRGGFLYEGTGLHGKSVIRRVELTTGRVLQQALLPARYFGEGIALWKDRLIQLTWQSQIAIVYNRETFRQEASFVYEGEGWGLTHDGKRLIMSDGSPTLTLRNPETFEPAGRIEVTDAGRPVRYLNELEWVKGRIYANVWQSEQLAVIDPRSGRVEAWIDLTALRGQLGPHGEIDVLNGVAYDEAGDRLFVTGKLWPKLFEIQVVERP
ncbi:MAG: glutaminyl-peptide cyclotransferase [Bryobacterales bacterium]|nr:glutaminyl-peptide cyclotransferase [Bryobacterales bacterium]